MTYLLFAQEEVYNTNWWEALLWICVVLFFLCIVGVIWDHIRGK